MSQQAKACSVSRSILNPVNHVVHDKKWNRARLQKAVQSVHNGMPIRRVAEEYGIPKSTLYDHASGKVGLNAKSGRHKHLDTIEEQDLESFLINCAFLGCARTKKETLAIVQQAVKQKGLDVNVSSGWWKSFLGRHPTLTLRVGEGISHSRALGANQIALSQYFDLLSQTLSEGELNTKPCQIFNLDETGMPLSPVPPKVIAKKGQKHPSSLINGGKGQVSILACVSAGGYCMPPLVIFSSRTLQDGMDIGEVPGTMYGLSDTGWMNKEIFNDWFNYHFLKYAPPARPLLVIMDSHSSHFTPDFINRAAEEDIIVMCLPPNSTHRTQPLDKGPFSPLKVAWKEECHSFLLNNPEKVISKFSFSAIFGKAWLKAMTPSNIIAGFNVTGIYPLNKNKLLGLPEEVESQSERPCIPFYQPLAPYASVGTPQRQSHVHIHLHHLTPSCAKSTSLSVRDSRSPVLTKSCSESEQVASQLIPTFTTEEIAKYQRRQEEGFDLDTDIRYNIWLKLQKERDVSSCTHSITQLQSHSTLSKLLDKQVPHIKAPALSNPSSSARVITSDDNRKRLIEKEEKKRAEIERKELAKAEREKKRQEKEKERDRKEKEKQNKKIELQQKRIEQQKNKIEQQKVIEQHREKMKALKCQKSKSEF